MKVKKEKLKTLTYRAARFAPAKNPFKALYGKVSKHSEGEGGQNNTAFIHKCVHLPLFQRDIHTNQEKKSIKVTNKK